METIQKPTKIHDFSCGLSKIDHGSRKEIFREQNRVRCLLPGNPSPYCGGWWRLLADTRSSLLMVTRIRMGMVFNGSYTDLIKSYKCFRAIIQIQIPLLFLKWPIMVGFVIINFPIKIFVDLEYAPCLGKTTKIWLVMMGNNGKQIDK